MKTIVSIVRIVLIELLLLVLIIIATSSCASKRIASQDANDVKTGVYICNYTKNYEPEDDMEEEAEDATTYDLIVLDSQFESWFRANAKGMNYYSPIFYQRRNEMYVAEWNALVNRSTDYLGFDYPFQERINYDPKIDYGIELEHKLFWYFKYIQTFYGAQFGFGKRTISN